MSTTTERTYVADASDANWLAGGVGGIAGALAMGALMFAMKPPTVAVAIPSLYGLAPPPNPLTGILVHVFHGAVLGLLFVGIADVLGVDSTRNIVGLGLVWGAVTWVLLAAVLMPVWLEVVGSPASPPLPNFAPPSLLWHLVYGLVLGGVYAATRHRL